MNLVNPHLHDPDSKRSYNKRLFSIVAPRYALATRLLSFGADGGWKRRLVRMIPDSNPRQACDLACGTGDISRLLLSRFPSLRLAALDLSMDMLGAQPRGLVAPAPLLCQADMHRLPFFDASIDLVTGGYALRNAPDITTAVAEISRVLAPGGVAGFLDFARSDRAPVAAIHHGLLYAWGAACGLVLHRDANVYAYIARSLASFPRRTAFAQLLAQHGLHVTAVRHFYGGMLQATICRKQPERTGAKVQARSRYE